MKNKLAFCSVIFTGNLIFLDDFLQSLEQQTDQDFTLLLFNDGVDQLEKKLEHCTFSYQIINVSGSIASVRTDLLEYLKKSDFDYVVFGDTDDYFPPNRVEVNRKLLHTYQVVANDLFLVDGKGRELYPRYWAKREELKEELTLESIKEYNFIGLGNSAMQVKAIPEHTNFQDDILAVDWLLFSRVLSKNVKTVFTSETFIYYRQHDSNTVGRKEMDLAQFRKGFLVKLNHYKVLAKENEQFCELAQKYIAFEPDLETVSLNRIVEKIKTDTPFWWEEIKI